MNIFKFMRFTATLLVSYQFVAGYMSEVAVTNLTSVAEVHALGGASKDTSTSESMSRLQEKVNESL